MAVSLVSIKNSSSMFCFFIPSLFLCGISVVALICSSWELPFCFERIYCWSLFFKSFGFRVLRIRVLQGIYWWWPSITYMLVLRLPFFFFFFFLFLFLSCMGLHAYKIVPYFLFFSCCRYGNVHAMKVPVDVHIWFIH